MDCGGRSFPPFDQAVGQAAATLATERSAAKAAATKAAADAVSQALLYGERVRLPHGSILQHSVVVSPTVAHLSHPPKHMLFLLFTLDQALTLFHTCRLSLSYSKTRPFSICLAITLSLCWSNAPSTHSRIALSPKKKLLGIPVVCSPLPYLNQASSPELSRRTHLALVLKSYLCHPSTFQPLRIGAG
jgi:hypothetical protein